MMTLKQAQNYARNLSELHGEKWLVFKTPANALCNKHPANSYNTGRYHACKESERAEYAAGGAEFV